MALVEGIGDEVLLAAALLAIAVIIFIAWASTQVRPLFSNGSVWMVHMQTAPERRVLEVYSLDERSAATQQLAAGALGVELTPSVNVEATLTASTSDDSDDSAESQRQDQPSDSPRSDESLRRRVIDDGIQSRDAQGLESQDDGHDTTTIRLKFLDDTQRMVAAWLQQTVGEFKRQHFENDVSQGKVVRLIYQGQLLRDDSRSLASYGLHENCVLHCHVSTTPYEQPGRRVGGRVGSSFQSSGRVESGLDLGRYIYVIFAFKFAVLWSAWFVFPEYFSRTSLVSLILCSGLFMLFWYGSQRRRPIESPSRVGAERAT